MFVYSYFGYIGGLLKSAIYKNSRRQLGLNMRWRPEPLSSMQ